MKSSQSTNNLRSEKLPQIHSSVSSNPLKLFPTRNDSIAKAFFSAEATNKNKRKLESKTRWLQPDSIDPQFGIAGDSQEIYVRRTYRRLQSSSIFSPTKKTDELSLKNLEDQKSINKKFIVIEESRLTELIKFESILKQEKELLGEQCTWVLSDFQFNARVPVPATRLAVHKLCEEQMKKMSKEIENLNKSWIMFSKQNHYDKPHLFLKESYIKNAPIGQKALKLRLVREAADLWRTRKERDTMLYEDDLSYLTGVYLDARTRTKDYDRYFILASRYGPYDEDEFVKDSRPGRRYLMAVTKGALKFQYLWDRYYAIQRLKRFRASRLIQKYFRRYRIYKQLHPIIKLRVKYGKKSVMKYYYHLWTQFKLLKIELRRQYLRSIHKYVKLCYNAWVAFVKGYSWQIYEKVKIMRIKQDKTLLLLNFNNWNKYRLHNKKVKTSVRRMFSAPHFELWVRYTKWSKFYRLLNRVALKITKFIRLVKVRIEYKRRAKAIETFKTLTLIAKARVLSSFKREQKIAEEFKIWSPQEKIRRLNKLNELEQSKLNRRQQIAYEKEKVAINDLKNHLRQRDGIIQINELLQEVITNNKHDYFYDFKNNFLDPLKPNNDKIQQKEYLKDKLISECSDIIRCIEIHNYNTKFPSYITCPDPLCRVTFTNNQQFFDHFETSTIHNHTNSEKRYSDLITSAENNMNMQSPRSDTSPIIIGNNINNNNNDDDNNNNNNNNNNSKISSKIKKLSLKNKSNLFPVSNFVESLKMSTFLSSNNISNNDANNNNNNNNNMERLRPQPGSSYGEFYMLIKSFKGQEMLKQFLSSIYGISEYINYLDLYAAIQDWKKINTNNNNYVTKAIYIYEHFLVKDSSRRVNLKIYKRKALINKLKAMKYREYSGYYHEDEQKYSKSFIRRLFNLNGLLYGKWTTESTLPPNIFDDLEWTLRNSDGYTFYESLEYQQYLHNVSIDEQNKEKFLLEDYKKYRKDQFLTWAMEYKAIDDIITNIANQSIDVLIDKLLLDELMNRCLVTQVSNRVKELSYNEQKLHEENCLLIDDSVEWMIENEIESIYEHYVYHFLSKRWEVPEYQAGMIEYSGTKKLKLKKKLNIQSEIMDKNNKKLLTNNNDNNNQNNTHKNKLLYEAKEKEWMNNIQNEITKEYKKNIPLNSSLGAMIIQKIVRGMLARKKARKLFVATYVKKYHNESGLVYYANLNTGDSTWEKPKFMKHLFPNSNW
eukprot:gene7137-9738_t